jgi:hypothetical protein
LELSRDSRASSFKASPRSGLFGFQALAERLHLLANIGLERIEAFLQVLAECVGGLGEALLEPREALLVLPHIGTKENVPDFIDVCALAQLAIGGVLFLSIGRHGCTNSLRACVRLLGHAGTLLRVYGVEQHALLTGDGGTGRP